MNDERPIEKLLRRAAQKRSAESGPAPELHPANRRLLQDEVARQFPQAATPPPVRVPEWWTVLKRRWVYGVAAFAAIWIVALAIVPMFSKPKSKEMLALNSVLEAKTNFAATDTARPMSPPPTAEPMVALEATEPQQLEFNSAQSAPPAAAQIVATTSTSAARVSANRDRESLIRPGAATPPFSLADSAATLRPTPVAGRQESKLKNAPMFATADEVSQERNSLGANSRAQSIGSAKNFGGTEFKKPAGVPAPALTKMESPAATRKIASIKEDFDSKELTGLVAAAPMATAEFIGEGREDKPWLARGGGEEKAPAERSSQAYSNLLGNKSARAKDMALFQASPNILANFRIEQAGRDMRVVDGDGSIYTGVVDPKNTLYKQMVTRQNLNLSNTYDKQFRFQPPKLTRNPVAGRAQAENYYFYRVEGTNRTLNQNVVFTWNFVATNSVAATRQLSATTGLKLDAAKQITPFSNLLQNSIITGRAQLGTSREIEVNATPVPR